MATDCHGSDSSYVASRKFTDYAELEAAVKDADLEMSLLGRPQAEWSLIHARLDRGSLQSGTDGAACTSTGTVSQVLTGFVLSMEHPKPQMFNGYWLEGSQFVFYRPGAEIYGSSSGPCRWVSFGVPPEDMARCVSALAGRDPQAMPDSGTLIVPDAERQQALYATLSHALAVAEKEPAVLQDAEARHGMEQSLLTAFVQALASSGGTPIAGERARQSRRRTVLQAEEYLRANIDKPIYLADLCGATGVSERSLHDAFMQTFGVSPIRYLKIRRLNQVRRALLAADRGLDSVVQIAAKFGVWEMGRFAGEYRALFGEYPSRTLGGTGPIRPGDGIIGQMS